MVDPMPEKMMCIEKLVQNANLQLIYLSKKGLSH